jgi:hypothetical protein
MPRKRAPAAQPLARGSGMSRVGVWPRCSARRQLNGVPRACPRYRWSSRSRSSPCGRPFSLPCSHLASAGAPRPCCALLRLEFSGCGSCDSGRSCGGRSVGSGCRGGGPCMVSARRSRSSGRCCGCSGRRNPGSPGGGATGAGPRRCSSLASSPLGERARGAGALGWAARGSGCRASGCLKGCGGGTASSSSPGSCSRYRCLTWSSRSWLRVIPVVEHPLLVRDDKSILMLTCAVAGETHQNSIQIKTGW